MRRLTKYIPQDDFDMPKEIDRLRYTAVLIRQSDHNAEKDHVFSRESQLKLRQYAMRLRGDETDKWIRLYDEGSGVSGQKRIDQRKELNRLYKDIKEGFINEDGVKCYIGSLVIVHEDRLFRDEYHTNDTTFMQLLAEHDVLLFVRTDHRRYDCTKPSDRNTLLEKMIASRNYLDDHVLGRMNGSQEVKALQGLFIGNNLPMGLVTKGKKKEQVILVYKPWAPIVLWMFKRFKELDNLYKLGHEIEVMPFLFPDPPIEDFLQYTFKINMTKVPGGFKPTSIDTIKYMLANLSYAGVLIYKGALVGWDNHEAIVDRELALWSYYKITGCDLEGNPLEGVERRRWHTNSAQAVLKYLLTTPAGVIYTANAEQPEYHRETLVSDNKQKGKLFSEKTFCLRADVIDDIFLERVKALAIADQHLAEHIKVSIDELEEQHVEAVVSIDDQLRHVRLQIEKTLAFLHDKILTLTPPEKIKYNRTLAGLRKQEKELLEVQEQSAQTNLQADFQELSDVLADIPGTLDACTMERKQRLARLITEKITIEEVSVHWLRFTVVWRGSLAYRADVCFIWCQRGRRRVEDWSAEDDAYIREQYPEGDKWAILQHFPDKSWNMIRDRSRFLNTHRQVAVSVPINENVTISDLEVIPDRDIALQILQEVSQRANKTSKRDNLSYGVWLYPAGFSDFASALERRDSNNGEWACPPSSNSNAASS